VADVLLTHSYHLAFDPKQVRKMQPYAPLGTLYAATTLQAQQVSVAIFDTMLQDPMSGFLAALNHHRPKIVAIYEDDFNFLSKMCLTRMREVAWHMAQIARDAGATVIAHGSDATDHAELFLQNGIHYILQGEAEHTLLQLCIALLRNESIAGIDGLVMLGLAGKATPSSLKAPKNPLWADLPQAARSLIDMEPYRHAWTEAHGYFSANVVASRGCPYRCNWCAKPISGDKFQLRSAAAVAEEISVLKEQHGAQHIWFSDDVFGLNHHWVQQFALEMTARNSVLPFKIQSRADLMSEENVAALKRAGCAEVWMGVESGSQKILDAMDKGLRIASVLTARERLQHAGIRACYFLQFGYPGETWEDIQQTIALVRATRPDEIGVSLSYPLPGTVFYERVQTQLGSKRNWTDSDDLCVMFQAAYNSDFYRAIRDALHAEVDSWQTNPPQPDSTDPLQQLWQKVFELEPVSRNKESTTLPNGILNSAADGYSHFVPLEQLSASTEV
jgi:anaerobic magnesium-protoporphyrin IX monomethyl ester cyclase